MNKDNFDKDKNDVANVIRSFLKQKGGTLADLMEIIVRIIEEDRTEENK